jgi:rhodanese-related sulfurtransferase
MRTCAELVAALRPAGWLLAAACLPALLAIWLHPRAPTLASAAPPGAAISVNEAVALLRSGDVLWIDARRADAFAAGHIPGAVPLREDAWEDLLPGFIEAWQPGQRVVVYCDGGGCAAARSVADRLRREFALENVAYLEGGWEAWQQTQP